MRFEAFYTLAAWQQVGSSVRIARMVSYELLDRC